MTQSNDPEFVVFGILPTEDEKKRRKDPRSDPTHFHGGVYQTMAVDELAVLYDALRQVDDPDYAAECDAAALADAEELGIDISNGMPPRPAGDERLRVRAGLIADIERVKTRQAKRIQAVGIEGGGEDG